MTMSTLRNLFSVPAILVVRLCLAATAPAADTTKPNFVVILIDDMGYGDIGPFGSKLNRTPNLDRMAAEGMKLTSFYAAPVCTPVAGPDDDRLLCQTRLDARRDLPGVPHRAERQRAHRGRVC